MRSGNETEGKTYVVSTNNGGSRVTDEGRSWYNVVSFILMPKKEGIILILYE